MQTFKVNAGGESAADVSPDAVLIRLCGEFVQTVRAKDALMETAPASPEARAVSDRARELLDDLLVQRATTPEGQKAQMEALKALGRPVLDYEQMIREAPDWFGQVAAAIIRDQVHTMTKRPAQSALASPTGILTPYQAAMKMQLAQRLKDQRNDAESVLESGYTRVAEKRVYALDRDAAESMELLFHEMMPFLPSHTPADAAVQVFTALETLRAMDLEPVGGASPFCRSENLTRVKRCLSSALPVLVRMSEKDLAVAVDPVVLGMPEQEHGLFSRLWSGAEAVTEVAP
ncbi:hypothetical protein QMA67_03995 [Gluconobacter japonicus]|uniref:hypothetical protein n=1 Tax=Gluconobacter japonicus TaxID=376620 RepID=UPI0024ACDD6C|nr:hypothetical protein [Gluconobacter japonicus]MDI6652107.1 hypothetical protein [Gluconobacter japonicus]